ncbi:eukaryotic translation initiation factor 4E isoform 1 [Tropilaelaps mercedesae]|uniref:Eukaryotic translation initiation factor 4E isoform 1 n=1 Tax=Tropilaelaps mercedesae TaxID=418985 RepID=A0A1V9Y2Q4_9ACAR|nr:eukaryotic translation initiation factor 4E isoform 1 [Tropilaelaps mercedesae]
MMQNGMPSNQPLTEKSSEDSNEPMEKPNNLTEDSNNNNNNNPDEGFNRLAKLLMSCAQSPRNAEPVSSEASIQDPERNKLPTGKRHPTSVNKPGQRRARQPGNQMDPLEFSWTFWVTDTSKDWNEAIERIFDFSTAQDFWRLFNFLVPPSVRCKLSYNLFKQGIRPEWEDPANASGGRWGIVSPLSGKNADTVWMELCMLCVGGFELDSLSSYINGIYLTWKRDLSRISIWLNTTERDVVMCVGETIQKYLQEHMKRKYALEFTECKSARGRKSILYSIN